MQRNSKKVVAIALTLAASSVALGRVTTYTENFNTNTDFWPWQGLNNRTSPQNYGWSNTDNTGTSVNPPGGTATGAGEMGGVLTRASSPANYYAFPLGSLDPNTTPLSAKGVIVVTAHSGSSGFFLGYFSGASSYGSGGNAQNFAGAMFDDGFDTWVNVFDASGNRDRTDVPTGGNLTTGVVVPFQLDWAPPPSGSSAKGQMTVTVNGVSATASATGDPLQTFTHFGIMPVSASGKGDTVYIDDVTFTIDTIPPQPPATWNVNSSGDWANPSNWNPGSPSGVGVNVILGSAINAARTVYTDLPVTAGSIKFDNANTYQIVGNGSLSIDVASGSGSIEVDQGTHKINLPLYLKDNTIINTLAGSTLVLLDPTELTPGITVNKNGTGTVTVLSTVNAAGPATIKVNGGVLNLAATNSDPDISINVDPSTVNIGADQTFGSMTLSLGGNTLNVGVDLNGAATPARLTVNDLHVSGGGAANVLNQTLAGNAVIVNGGLEIQANSKLIRQGPGVLRSSTISMDTTGRLDITDGKMIVDNEGGTVATSVRALIKSGAIFSSTADSAAGTTVGYALASQAGITTFGGESVNGSNMLVRYTYAGDANLSGQVDTVDFNLMAANFGASGKDWIDGDFNHDGIIDTVDFNQMASNFGKAPLESASLGGVVPEPASLAAIGLFAGVVTARRRRGA